MKKSYFLIASYIQKNYLPSQVYNGVNGVMV